MTFPLSVIVALYCAEPKELSKIDFVSVSTSQHLFYRLQLATLLNSVNRLTDSSTEASYKGDEPSALMVTL